MTAMFSSDIGLLKNEIKGAGTALREPSASPPSVPAAAPLIARPSVRRSSRNELLAHFRAIPAPQRARTEVKDALRSLLVRKYPCPA